MKSSEWTEADSDECRDMESESNLHVNMHGSMKRMTQSMVVKYLRKYDKGPGYIRFGLKAKHRYHKDDVNKAYHEMLDNEPKDENGCYLNKALLFHQCENNL